MIHRIVPVTIAMMLMAVALYGQRSVCDLFKDLKAADGLRLIVTGELIISKDVAVLGAADCDNQYRSRPEDFGAFQLWPTALHLRPSTIVSASQMRQFQDGAAEADRLRSAGKFVSATASFFGSRFAERG
jgi:hypothetical protein